MFDIEIKQKHIILRGFSLASFQAAAFALGNFDHRIF